MIALHGIGSDGCRKISVLTVKSHYESKKHYLPLCEHQHVKTQKNKLNNDLKAEDL